MADLTPTEGSLLWVTPRERRLIEKMRADPDQHRHLAGLGDGDVTVRHPIEERIDGNIWACGALESAAAALANQPDTTGKWRWEADGSWERIG